MAMNAYNYLCTKPTYMCAKQVLLILYTIINKYVFPNQIIKPN